MRALLAPLVAFLVLLTFFLSSTGTTDAAAGSALAVECAAPRTLSLRRFEDGSARLECAGRTLVRVSVPR